MLLPMLEDKAATPALRRWARRLDRGCDPVLIACFPAALITALVVLMSGCGSSDDPAPPEATSAAQIDAARLALDGSTTDGAATLEANQTALDADDPVPPGS